MCRNIKPLFNFDPPVTDEEVRDASLQFVRKISGFTRPSKANEAAFETAVEQISEVARTLLDSSEKALARHVLTQTTRRHDTIIARGDPALISLVGSSALLLAILHARDANTEVA